MQQDLTQQQSRNREETQYFSRAKARRLLAWSPSNPVNETCDSTGSHAQIAVNGDTFARTGRHFFYARGYFALVNNHTADPNSNFTHVKLRSLGQGGWVRVMPFRGKVCVCRKASCADTWAFQSLIYPNVAVYTRTKYLQNHGRRRPVRVSSTVYMNE